MFSNFLKSLAFLISVVFFSGTARAYGEVVVLIAPQEFVVSKIVAQTLTVKTLLPASQSLEHFSPSPGHLRSLEKAKLYVRLGHPAISIEPQLIDLIVKEAGIDTVTMSAKIDLDQYDPHYWLSLKNIEPMIDAILPALIKLKPENKDLYTDNAKSLKDEAHSLHQTLTTKLKPIVGKSFMVFHPSWQYFASSFGLKQLAIEEHGREPGPRMLESIISTAKQAGIKCIFQEPQISSAATKAIAEHINAQVGVLNPLNNDIFAGVSEAADKILMAIENGACS